MKLPRRHRRPLVEKVCPAASLRNPHAFRGMFVVVVVLVVIILLLGWLPIIERVWQPACIHIRVLYNLQ